MDWVCQMEADHLQVEAYFKKTDKTLVIHDLNRDLTLSNMLICFV